MFVALPWMSPLGQVFNGQREPEQADRSSPFNPKPKAFPPANPLPWPAHTLSQPLMATLLPLSEWPSPSRCLRPLVSLPGLPPQTWDETFLHRLGDIPDSWDLFIPDPSQRAHLPRPGYLTFFKALLQSGLRFPIPALYQSLAKHYWYSWISSNQTLSSTWLLLTSSSNPLTFPSLL